MSELVTQIKQAARELGFELAGIASVEPLERDDIAFHQWCEQGFAAGMDYMTRRPELHAHPRTLVPYAQSLMTLAVDYATAAPVFEHEHRYGRVARYAWGLDYHDVVKPRLQMLVRKIEEIAGREIHARCFVDAVPLLERALAARAGLGFFGKNTNLLQPRSGSWFFLALIPRELRAAMGDWVFGCDVCQDVCPFNRFASDTRWPEFRPEAGVGPRLDLVELLSILSDDEFRVRFRGTPLTRPKRRGLLRNAAVVAANVVATAAVPVVIERIENDPDGLIRSHCLWALSQLDPKRAAPIAERALKSDPDALVHEEAEMILGH